MTTSCTPTLAASVTKLLVRAFESPCSLQPQPDRFQEFDEVARVLPQIAAAEARATFGGEFGAIGSLANVDDDVVAETKQRGRTFELQSHHLVPFVPFVPTNQFPMLKRRGSFAGDFRQFLDGAGCANRPQARVSGVVGRRGEVRVEVAAPVVNGPQQNDDHSQNNKAEYTQQNPNDGGHAAHFDPIVGDVGSWSNVATKGDCGRMSLFEQAEAVNFRRAQPLAARMRPVNLDEVVGQQHFLGEGKLLRRLLKADRLGSVIFYGPPGTGKTTLARLLATESRRRFKQLNAVTSGVKELREVLEAARDDVATGTNRTLLFIDEIHRFNKTQQDALLPDVEDGVVTLVGATTANPFFAVNSALVSRSQIFQFEPLSPEDVRSLLRRALADKARGLGNHAVHLHDDALAYLAEVCDGDARRALAALEIGVLSATERPVEFTRALAEESVQRKAIQYDPTGDDHYDVPARSSKVCAAAIRTRRCTGWRGCWKRGKTCGSFAGGW